MNAREMIARLQQIDPETEIVNVETDVDYGQWYVWEVEEIANDGGLRYGKILRSGFEEEDA